jgi:predicted RNase H-like HicB family nuclease
MQYVGLIHRDAGSDYGVSFPDFPGVVTAGLVEDGETIPEASSLEAIMADPPRTGMAWQFSSGSIPDRNAHPFRRKSKSHPASACITVSM